MLIYVRLLPPAHRDPISDILSPGDFLSILSEIERNYLCVLISLPGSSPQLTMCFRLRQAGRR